MFVACYAPHLSHLGTRPVATHSLAHSYSYSPLHPLHTLTPAPPAPPAHTHPLHTLTHTLTQLSLPLVEPTLIPEPRWLQDWFQGCHNLHRTYPKLRYKNNTYITIVSRSQTPFHKRGKICCATRYSAGPIIVYQARPSLTLQKDSERWSGLID